MNPFKPYTTPTQPTPTPDAITSDQVFDSWLYTSRYIKWYHSEAGSKADSESFNEAVTTHNKLADEYDRQHPNEEPGFWRIP